MKDYVHRINRTLLGLSFCFAALAISNTQNEKENDGVNNAEITTKDKASADAPNEEEQLQKTTQTPTTTKAKQRVSRQTQKPIQKKTISAVTADDQAKGSDRDVSITRQIRSSLVSDEALSISAKNINITTIDGKVTLRGSVKSPNEHSAIQRHARNIVSETKINNLVEVKP